MFGSIGCVGTFGGRSGEALVFASPFASVLVVIAQTYPLTLLCDVGKGQTDGQSGRDNTLAWVSLGMVAGAIALSVVIVEVRFRWNRRILDRQLEQAASLSQVAA